MTDEEKKIHDLKFELRQQRQRIDKLEQIVEKDRKVISMLLQISNNLLDYINVTAAHVRQLERGDRNEKLYIQVRCYHRLDPRKNGGKNMIFEILAVAHLLGRMPVTPWGDDLQKVRCTCYLPTGNKTYDGTVPYEGICAANKEHLGDVALLYSLEGEFIGFFECRDVGGNVKLRNGTAIDIFRYDMDRAWDWVHTYGDYVQIIWIEAEG